MVDSKKGRYVGGVEGVEAKGMKRDGEEARGRYESQPREKRVDTDTGRDTCASRVYPHTHTRVLAAQSNLNSE